MHKFFVQNTLHGILLSGFLHVSLDVSLQRKPGHTSQEVAPKIQAIERMDRRGLHIIDIDADQPFERTVSQIEAALCNIL